jgi:hypothetical protein
MYNHESVAYCTYEVRTNQTIHIPIVYGSHTGTQITTQPFKMC